MTLVTAATLPTFDKWLVEKRPLGIALNAPGTVLGVADLKTAWTVDIADEFLVRAVASKIQDRQRRAWAMSPEVVHTLARVTEYDLEDFSWINDVAVAFHSAHPGVELPLMAPGAGPRARQAASLMKALALQVPAAGHLMMNLTVALDQAFRESQRRGVRVDVEGLREAQDLNRSVTAAATAEDGIDLSAVGTDAQAEAVTGWLAGRDITIRDFDGRPSLSRDFFDRAQIPDSSEGRYFWGRFRAAASRRSARLSLNQIANNLHDDGHVFPMVHLRGAKTGRGSVTGPALTSLSKKYRSLIIPEDGAVFISLDFDRAEPTVAAALSQDEGLQEALSTTDVYRELAVKVFGEQAREDDIARATCKTIFLGILYGRGAQGLSQQLGISKAEATETIRSVWDSFPALNAYCEGLKADAIAGKELRTPWGRLLPVPNRGPYQTPNLMIQASAADVFYVGLKNVVELLGADRLTLPIHDEILLQSSQGDVFRSSALLEEAMTVPFLNMTVTGQTKQLGGSWSR
ncbi:DNA polymerase A [marine actinobacterium PHSC20C1]|nr:DNA polymerase A [marine actinobacterium PHSC20C1]